MAKSASESRSRSMLSRIIPQPFKAALRRTAARALFPTPATPRFQIGAEHCEGGEVLANRTALVQRMPSHAVVAELGVDEGDFSKQILLHSNPLKLHLVDVWNSNRYHEGKARGVQGRFSMEIAETTVQVHRSLSIDACAEFPDEYFDWIYIDTSHSYRTTIDELLAYERTVKPSGYICGHDYVLGNWSDRVRYGVIEAVAEFCVRRNWRLAYWTADFTESNSFAITRI